MAKSNLMSLISSGGYNIHRHFQDNSWTEGDAYYVEVSSRYDNNTNTVKCFHFNRQSLYDIGRQTTRWITW